MKLIDKQLLRTLHKPGWSAFWLTLLYVGAFVSLLGGIGWSVDYAHYALVISLVVVQAFVFHAFLIAFHESAHGSLCPVGVVNGYLGRAVGMHSFMSLTLYRATHHWHHAYIGDTRDEEFWPLNDPTVPRWKRRLAAFLELTCGLVWTPLLFLRAFLRRGTEIRDRAIRRLIWIELASVVAFWLVVMSLVLWFNVLSAFVVAFLIPAVIAGNVQSLRKYVEHVGLTGQRGVALTRSVRNPSRMGRLLSWLLFQEPYHDVHHLYPKVPQESLPIVVAAEDPLPPDLPLFENYKAAFRDLLHGLADPKFGKAWAKAEELASTPAETVHALGNSANRIVDFVE